MTHPVLRKLHAYARLLRKQANTFQVRYRVLFGAITFERSALKAARRDTGQPFWWRMKNAAMISAATFVLVSVLAVLFRLGEFLVFWRTSPNFEGVWPWEQMVSLEFWSHTIGITVAFIVVPMMMVGYLHAKQCLQGYLLALKLLNAGRRPVQLSFPL